jgi:hypothetical protein
VFSLSAGLNVSPNVLSSMAEASLGLLCTPQRQTKIDIIMSNVAERRDLS